MVKDITIYGVEGDTANWLETTTTTALMTNKGKLMYKTRVCVCVIGHHNAMCVSDVHT